MSASETISDQPNVPTGSAVCLVDDDPSVRKSIGRLLESAGFNAHSFGDPKEFLAHLAHNHVSVAVLDIWMETMTGMDLLVHLCAKSPNTSVIFITAHENNAVERTAMKAGAFALFIKPLNDERFLAAVRKALTRSI